MNRCALFASTAILSIATTATAATMQSGQVDGLNYQILLPSGGCSTAKPCQIVEYLHYLGGENNVPSDIQNYFGAAYQAAHPNTIIVAPQINGSSGTNNWGGVRSGVSPNGQAAVDAVKQVASMFATNPNSVTLTGGSMGGIGTEALMEEFGPKGTTGQHIFAAGLAYDGAIYNSDAATEKAALCGIPLTIQHGGADTTVPTSVDQSLAKTLSGCAGFSYIEIAGAGHGTWNDSTGYADGKQLANVIAEAAGAPPMSPNTANPNGGAQAGAAQAAAFTTKLANLTTASATVSSTTCTSTNGGGLLPAGYLSTRGNQVVDQNGNAVRIASVGWNEIWGDLPKQVSQMRDYGFNAIRISWTNASFDSDLALFKQVVAAAQTYGLKVILDHHTDEQGTAADGMGSQQANGLWYDVGPGSDGTNGVGIKGTVDQAKFQRDWVAMAQAFTGNPTVIGMDMDNEPLFYGNSPSGGVNWGQGGPNDILTMYETVGDAIHAVNPGVLIITEGPIGDGQQGHPKDFDLRGALTKPVVLKQPNKVMYSIHSYPRYVGGQDVDSGPALVQMMNNDWGFLITKNIAPVWIGEMGANFDGSYGGENAADSRAWFQTVLNYTSGMNAAQGGPTFTQGQAGISFDWWAWGNLSGQQLEGTMTASGVNQTQKTAVDQLIVGTCAKAMSVLRSTAAPATDAAVMNAMAKTPMGMGIPASTPSPANTTPVNGDVPPSAMTTAALSTPTTNPTMSTDLTAATPTPINMAAAPEVPSAPSQNTPTVAVHHHHHRVQHNGWTRRPDRDNDGD